MTEETRLRKQRTQERERAARNDEPAALELCRRIRDDETAAIADRLRAVELIMQIKKEDG